MGKYITVVTKQTKLASIINLQEYIVIQTLAVESRYINWKKERKKKKQMRGRGEGNHLKSYARNLSCTINTFL